MERIKRIFINFSIIKIGLLFFVPLLLATPFPPVRDVGFSLKNRDSIEIPSETESLGTTAFSKLLGIKTFKIPISLCLFNNTKLRINDGGAFLKELEKSARENIGAASYNIVYPNQKEDARLEFYVKRNHLKCENLRFDKTPLKNEGEIREVIPSTSLPEEVRIILKEYPPVKVEPRISLFAVPDFYSKAFLINYLLFLIACSLLLNQFSKTKELLKKKNMVIILIKRVVKKASSLKNLHTSEKDAPVSYVCIFSQNQKECEELLTATKELGSIIKETPTGPLFKISPIETVAGKVQLVKIRMPDPTRPERGDADFTVSNYESFKKTYADKPGFKLIPREGFEMIELMDPKFNVRIYFSNPPVDKQYNLHSSP